MRSGINKRTVAGGSVLVLCLWVLLFLSVIAVAIGSQVSMVLRLASGVRERGRCVDLVRSGAECAIAQVCMGGMASATNRPDLFMENGSLGEGVFSVSSMVVAGNGIEEAWGVQPESSKVNLNVAGSPEIARMLVERAELDKTVAESIAACVVDWRDGDDEALTDGAEAAYYSMRLNPYPCHNGYFDVIEELLLVKGMTEAIFRRIKPYVTVYEAGAFGGRVEGRLVERGTVAGEGAGVKAWAEFVCGATGRKLFWHEY
jgi:general secretion pathway protein K